MSGKIQFEPVGGASVLSALIMGIFETFAKPSAVVVLIVFYYTELVTFLGGKILFRAPELSLKSII